MKRDNSTYIEIFNKYLKKEASSLEVKLLIDWLLTNDFEAWMNQQWSEASAVSTDFSAERRDSLLNEIKSKIKEDSVVERKESKPAIKRIYAKTASVAAIVLLLIASSYITYTLTSVNNDIKQTIVYAERGQKANTILPDGSIAYLNADSKIAYGDRFNNDERVVYATGEVYFVVSEDQNRPFIVETPDLDVKVYGTSFNVNTYYRNDTRVSLLEGSVEVLTKNKQSAFLNPDEILTYDAEISSISIEEGNAESAIEWRYNRLRFKRESLASIIEKLERNFNVDVEIKNETIKNRHFTGDFSSNETIEQILDIMSSNKKFSYSMKGNKIEIY